MPRPKQVTTKRARPEAQAQPPAETLSDQIDAFAGDPDFMTSLARGLAVVQAFDQEHIRLTVAQTSERTGLPRSAARRCLYTLQQLGYVDAEGRSFFLKPRIVSLGHFYLTAVPLSVSAQPVLDKVAGKVNETCTLAVLDRDEILFIAHSAKVPMVSVNIAIGSRLPAHCTANGRVLLAALSPEELEVYFSHAKLTRLTEATLTAKKALSERLKQVRKDGFALVDQEFNMNVRSIAVPVRRAGRTVASMSIAVPVERVTTAELERRLLPYLLAAAAEFA
jgi:IclR family pca regulon transcriptional regulator